MIRYPIAKIEKIQEEIKYCNRAVAPILVDVSLMLGRKLYKNEISPLEYEEKMEEVKMLSEKFNNECLCTKSETMLDLISPKSSKKKHSKSK